MLTSLYRRLIPRTFRQFLYDLFLGRIVFFFRNINVILKSKFTYIFSFLLPKTEENNVFAFMGKHGLTSYPYDYALEYKRRDIRVEVDPANNLPFVLHQGRRLYFPESFPIEKVQRDYRALITEQDIRSAHRYVRSYDELRGKTLLDVGAAEGIFSLDVIDLVKQVILFEYLEDWHKPLQATFAAWPDKVKIVKRYVGNLTSGNHIRIDDFLSGQNVDDLFIKMDIEGAERMALDGAKDTLRKGKRIALAVCTYHRPGDPEYVAEFLKNMAYEIEFSDGLMYWNKRVSKGVLRAKKISP